MDLKEENERKKAYLNSYRAAVREEKILLEEIQKLRTDKMFPSVVNDGMPHGSGGGDLSEYAAKLDEAINDLKEQRLKKVRLYTEIQQRIKCVEDDTERELLMLRYLQRKTWEQVAVEMGYSWQHVHKLHSRALSDFKM